MKLTDKQRKYLNNAPNFDDDIQERLQNPEYQKGWLELSLEEFLQDGDINSFTRALTYVVKARVKASGRGEITRLAKELSLDRSNLSEIVNGDKQPRLDTALKLLNGLGYTYDIKLQSA